MIHNLVIKSETPEMGKEIIDWWRSKGVDVDKDKYTGYICESRGCAAIYYGVIDGVFANYSFRRVIQNGAEIIKLPKYEKEIIGWKLIKPEYRDAVRQIVDSAWYDDHFDSNLIIRGWNFKDSNSEKSVAQKLREAGILKQWFEPVYKEICNFNKGDVVIGWHTKSFKNFNVIPWIIGRLNETSTRVRPFKFDNCETSIENLRKPTHEEMEMFEIVGRLPIIKGYSCQVNSEKENFSWGCVKISFEAIIHLRSVTISNGATINSMQISEMKKLIKYLKS